MRTDNLIIVGLGVIATVFAVLVTVWWGGLPVRSPEPAADPQAVRRTEAFNAAAWSLAAVLSAGAVAGMVVGGLLARVIMRIAGGVSPPEAQGRLTEAEETVGEITVGGTLAVVVFVGLVGGIVAVGLYLLARPWLPATARGAGVLIGLFVMGLLGPGDPLNPDNIDFDLLSYDLLTVLLIIGGSLLFGTAFASLAARFDVAAQGRSPARWLLGLGYLVLAFVPLIVAALVYLGGRTILPGRLRPLLHRRPVQIVGRVLLMVIAAVMVVRLAVVSVDIVTD